MSPDMELFSNLQEPFLYLFFIWAFVFFVIDFYELNSFRRAVSFLRGAAVFSIVATVSGTAYFYLQPDLELTPRAILFLTVLNFTVLSSLWRFLLFSVIGSKNFRKKVFLIGFCKEAEEVIDKDSLDYEITGIYTKEDVSEKIKKKIKVVSDIFKVKEEFEDAEILVLSPDIKDDKKSIKTIFSSFSLNIKYMDFSSLYEEITKKVPLRSLDEWWFLENISRPQKRISEMVNRALEIVISIPGILFLIVLFPFIALLIKLDSKGPVLYRQKRVGWRGTEFVLYKFRTMRFLSKKEDIPWREEDKEEVTRVGAFLRKYHLDELPQLYNIIRGDLGFVGPRPEITKLSKMFEKEIPFYKLRYLVRPGLTGWAQINYPPSKNTKEAEEKFKYDLYYIKNRSFFLDIVIVLKSLRTIF